MQVTQPGHARGRCRSTWLSACVFQTCCPISCLVSRVSCLVSQFRPGPECGTERLPRESGNGPSSGARETWTRLRQCEWPRGGPDGLQARRGPPPPSPPPSPRFPPVQGGLRQRTNVKLIVINFNFIIFFSIPCRIPL